MTITNPVRMAADTLVSLARSQGGGTVHLTDASIYPGLAGYAVGGAVQGITFPVDTPDPAYLILEWITNAPDLDYAGSWLHDGTIYIDAVEIVPELDAALALAEARNEIAIFDFATLDEIRVRD